MPDLITENTTILAPPRGTAAQARDYILARGSVYDAQSIATIVDHYWRYAPPVGLDPLLAIAQCIHETSDQDPATGKWRPLSSWWAQRPRRNPAGIGVTGETKVNDPNDPHNWAEDTRPNPPIWRAGLSFASWDDSSRAHIGRLLAYAVPLGEGTDPQKALLDFALGMRPLPNKLRGSALTLRALGAKHNPTGSGWATPGDTYGAKIAQIAQDIVA